MPSFVRFGASVGVNSQTTSSQNRPSITALSDGGYVIVWQTANSAQDGSGFAIKSQRYNSLGVAVGGETLVNNVAAADQSWPRVSALASGGYVVTWETSDSTQDGNGTAIKARLFDAAGAPVGGEFLVNSQTFMDQQQPTVVGLAGGGFVIAWQTTDTSQDGAGWAVKAQRYDSSGAAVGAEFRVNTTAFGSQNNIDIASLANGGFVVTWQTGNSAGTQINAQAYGADGVKAGGELLVTNGFSSHTAGRVAGLPNGGFVVTWQTDNGEGIGIRAQIFDAARNKVGTDFIVNPGTSGFNPDVAVLADGTFLITWEGRHGGIKSQTYSATGQRLGSEYVVYDGFDEGEYAPAVAALANGNFVVGWTANPGFVAGAEDIRMQMMRPNTAPQLGADTRAISTAENNQNFTTITATDTDGPSSLTYSIVGGTDAARFSITASTGALRFVTSPNFEAPSDSNGDNVYQVIVRVSDGDLFDLQTINVTVTNVNEAVTIISNGGGTTAAITLMENSSLVTTVAATDVENAPITYSIAGGTDAALFAIDAATGALTFITAPDYENPADGGANNVYQVTVRASDGQLTDTQQLTITVADQDEAPVISSDGGGDYASINVDENSSAVTTVVASSQVGPVTYSITSGLDAHLFTIDAATGVLSFIQAPDHENPHDLGGDGVYSITVSASNGVQSDSQSLQIHIVNVDEGVTFAAPASAFEIAENEVEVGTLSAITELGTPLTYSISGGADAALFTIDAATGALRFLVAPDYDAPSDTGSDNVYEIIVTADDGYSSATQPVTISVANVDEDIRLTSYAGAANVALTLFENGLSVGQVAASDPEGDVTHYYVSGGADQHLFTIDLFTGALSFAAGPNFEAPADADGDNVYDVRVSASSESSEAFQYFAITIANVNEGIAITSGGGGASAAVSMGEGQAAVTVVTSADPDGTSAVYSIAGGADASRFTIDAATGALSLVSAPDFEAPADAGGDNVYDVVVAASDGEATDTQALSVTVTNVYEAVRFASPSLDLSVDENSDNVGYSVVAVGDEGASLTYSIVGGEDASRFNINPVTGALSFVMVPDYDMPSDPADDNHFNLVVRASDGTSSATQSISVTILDVNEPIYIYSHVAGETAAVTHVENNLLAATVMAWDEDFEQISFAVTGGADAAKFTVNEFGELSFVAGPDFEIAGDADGDNVYDVVVTASSETSSDSRTFAITIADVNEKLFITSDGGGETSVSLSRGENGLHVTTVVAEDRDGDAPLYTIADGADASLFTIDPASGALRFREAPDFEAPGDADGDNVYEVIVGASDGDFFTWQAFQLTIANADEPVTLHSHGGASSVSLSVAENGQAVTQVAATDGDGGPVAYAITGGADAAFFAVDAATGALSFLAAPDFEAPADAGGDNVYDVVVTASAGGSTAAQAFAVGVSNANERLFITSNGGGTSTFVPTLEGARYVTTVVAADPDGPAITYSILGGPDADRFTIDPVTGVLSFVDTPDHEAPADAGEANFYTVQVGAGDGEFTAWQSVQIGVGNVDEPVIVTSHGGAANVALTVGENGLAVTQVVAVDTDRAPVTYSISGGADAAAFAVNAQTGALTFVGAPNYESPADAGGDNVYDVVVTASDGNFTASQSFAITVSNSQEAVAITSNGGGASASVSVGENGLAVATVAGSDPDGGAVTYAIAGGADAGRFTIDAETGTLAFIAAPDFEAPGDAGANNVYEVIVSASDGTSTDLQALSVSVGNVNEGVAITSNGGGASASVARAENGVAVTTVAAADTDGDPVTYAIVGGADAASFTIDAVTGALAFVGAPNFETPADAGGNNVYDVIVSASDGSFSDVQALAVSVTNVNEGVAITSGGGGASASVSVGENQLGASQVVGVDSDGGPVTYSISGGADASRFTINAATGALAFVAAPDFEAPSDAGANNVYDVVVSVSDGTFTDSQAVAVQVGNVNEPLAITSNGGGASGSVSLAENVVAVATVAAADPDGGTVTYSIVGGADAARFTINAATGALSFVTAPNFDAPSDAGANNVYDVVVSASDGTFSDTQALAVSITNVREGNVVVGTSGSNTISTTTTVSGQPRATELEDTIYGMGGNDTILAAGGEDIVDGGSGNDTITGGLGADVLIGGTGADRFVYTGVADSRSGAMDVIRDFSRLEGDKINLSAIDARTNLSGDQAFTFIGTAAFSNVAGQLRYEQVGGNTFVQGDVDGNGVADFILQVDGQVALIASDFLL